MSFGPTELIGIEIEMVGILRRSLGEVSLHGYSCGRTNNAQTTGVYAAADTKFLEHENRKKAQHTVCQGSEVQLVASLGEASITDRAKKHMTPIHRCQEDQSYDLKQPTRAEVNMQQPCGWR